MIYEPSWSKVLPFEGTNPAQLVINQLVGLKPPRHLKIQNQTPLRIRRYRELLEKMGFAAIFKQCSLRLKFLTENYGRPLEYDFRILMQRAESVRTKADNLWRHNSSRRSNSQNKKFALDGMLGEIQIQNNEFISYLPKPVALQVKQFGIYVAD